MMQRNTPLLQGTMQHLLDNPEDHNQIIFVNICGTAACFAGRAALLAGWSHQTIYDSGVKMWAKGAILLGLTKDEAEILFNANNTRPMLELMVKDLVNGDELRDNGYYEELVAPELP